MSNIDHHSEASGQNNGDFRFNKKLASMDFLAVGDFAPSGFAGLDKLAVEILEESLKRESLSDLPPSLLLKQVAISLNNRLLKSRTAWPEHSFQCCVIFAVLQGTSLYYLPIGDCRGAIRRGERLILLNGSMWVDNSNIPLPEVITIDMKMQSGVEVRPQQVLGVTPVEPSEIIVQEFNLDGNDTVLLYSDGIDKVLSPGDLLKLLLAAPSGETPKELAERVLTEVSTKPAAADDRTLLVAFGPHVSADNEVIKAERLHNDQMHRQINERLFSIESSMQFLPQLSTNFSNLEGKLTNVTNAVQGLPTIQQIKEAVVATDGEDESQMERVSEQLTEVKDSLRNLTELVSGLKQEVYVNQPPHQEEKEKRQKHTTKESPEREPDSEHGEPESSSPPSTVGDKANAEPGVTAHPQDRFIKEFDKKTDRAREGIVLITRGRFELVDEKHAFDPAQQGSGKDGSGPIYLTCDKQAPPGWLTAWYLYLRRMAGKTQSNFTDKKLKAWMLHQSVESVNALPREKLIEVRDKHCWQVRNLRQAAVLENIQYERIALAEEKIADELFGQPAQEERKSRDAVHNPEGKDRGPMAWLMYMRSLKFIIVTSALLGLAVVIGIFRIYRYYDSPAPVQSTQTQSMQTSEPTATIITDADGRTLLLSDTGGVRESLGYYIQVGKEKEFTAKIASQKYTNKQQAQEFLRTEAGALVVSARDQLRPQPEQGFRSVDANDLKSGEPCANFLDRVNRQLPHGVHTNLDTLKVLNPDIRCNELRLGNELLVNVKAMR